MSPIFCSISRLYTLVRSGEVGTEVDAPSLIKGVSTPLIIDLKLVAHKLFPLGRVAYDAPRHTQSEVLCGGSFIARCLIEILPDSCPLSLKFLLPPVQGSKGEIGVKSIIMKGGFRAAVRT